MIHAFFDRSGKTFIVQAGLLGRGHDGSCGNRDKTHSDGGTSHHNCYRVQRRTQKVNRSWPRNVRIGAGCGRAGVVVSADKGPDVIASIVGRDTRLAGVVPIICDAPRFAWSKMCRCPLWASIPTMSNRNTVGVRIVNPSVGTNGCPRPPPLCQCRSAAPSSPRRHCVSHRHWIGSRPFQPSASPSLLQRTHWHG